MGGTRTAPDPALVLSWGACRARSLLRHGGDRQPREAPRTRTGTSHAWDTPACAGLCKRGRVSPTGDTIVRQPMRGRRQWGFVANFAQEVVKGQWPRSVGGIRRPAYRTVRPQ